MATVKGLDRALHALEAGETVVIPTDTVYGIAARPDLESAIAAIFRVKGRPREKALPVLGAHVRDLETVAAIDERVRVLADAFWPGPLTVVTRRAAGFVHDLGGSGEDSVAIRIPASPLTLDLLRASGPLAVTSANKSSEPPAATVAEARAALGSSVTVFLDGGVLRGQPSTVVSVINEPVILRQGALGGRDILEVLDATSLF